MKTLAKTISAVLLAQAACMGFYSCSQDTELAQGAPQEQTGRQTYTLNLNAQIDGYDQAATRADLEATGWYDGAIVFVQFHVNDTLTITGRAEYKQRPDTWVISFEETLPECESGKCSVCYFDSITSMVNDERISISQRDAIYSDAKATYKFNGIEISINAQMKPAFGRIRFLGSDKEVVTIAGLTYPSYFNARTFEFTYDSTELVTTCHVPNNGKPGFYTDYIYGDFTDKAKPSLYIDSNAGAFRRSCSNVSLVPGASGFISCPTNDNYNGWTACNRTDYFVKTSVDLGLPSKRLWARQNVDITRANGFAESPSASGSFISWSDAAGTNTSATQSYNIDITGSIAGNKEYDAATRYCGPHWRYPTLAEMEELVAKCKWEWTTMDGVQGYKVTGSNGESMFLPGCGLMEGLNFMNADNYSGRYWIGETEGEDSETKLPYRLRFDNKSKPSISTYYRYIRYNIRPVYD